LRRCVHLSLVPFLLELWHLFAWQMMAEMKNSDPGAADADADADADAGAGAAEEEADSESDDAPPPLEAA
jgi:hypothetical protein